MTLRAKLLAAQAPLALALAAIGVVASITNASLGRSSSSILEDNYRSVLAAQRMKEAIERLDSAALFILADRRPRALELAAANEPRFEAELAVQEHNLSEVGEREATAALRGAWNEYRRSFHAFIGAQGADPERLRRGYFDDLQPAFDRVKSGADVILGLNQDAMVRKSERAQRSARLFDTVILLVAASAFLAGIAASAALTARLLRPLSVLTQAARRLGEGDMAARARLGGRDGTGDEIASVAREFNTMADRLSKYRASSLGELLAAQQQAQAAIDSLADPVLVFDSAGNLMSANGAAANLLRVDLAAPAPLSGAEPAVRERVERLRADVLGGKALPAPRGFEEAIRVPASGGDGDAFFLPRAAPVRTEEGGVVGCTVVLQDVTRLLRFDELKTNLVATVAHELRTPLTSLRMAIHLLAEEAVGPVTEKQADLLHAGRQDTERLQQIVDDLLDLSRIQAGRLRLERRTLSVQAVLAEAVERFEAPARAKPLALRAEPALHGLEVFADPERLDLALGNLLANAVKYTPAGGAVTVRALPIETGGGGVRFEVEDDGPGVAPEHRQAVFERLFRAPGAPAGGAGLGLFIAREIVTAHGGSIGVGVGAGAGGRGALFWLELPAAAV